MATASMPMPTSPTPGLKGPLLGSIVWICGLAVLGREVGSDWQTWRHHLEYVDYVGVTLVVVAVGYLIVRHVRSDRDDPGAPRPLGVAEGEPADVVAD